MTCKFCILLVKLKALSEKSRGQGLRREHVSLIELHVKQALVSYEPEIDPRSSLPSGIPNTNLRLFFGCLALLLGQEVEGRVAMGWHELRLLDLEEIQLSEYDILALLALVDGDDGEDVRVQFGGDLRSREVSSHLVL